MTKPEAVDSTAQPASTATVDDLRRLDLAMEVLEGLDELGLNTRAEVEQLMAALERAIGDAE